MPPRKPRQILLAVAGATPATITEAIYALAVERRIPLSEVRILTTQEGRARIEPRLKDAQEDMRRDFPARIKKLPITFRVFETPAGQHPPDVRTTEENEELADWILAETARACSNSQDTVHASLAGGRKTMSFYLGAAMQLAGRSQDRLYHVLVDPEFEHPAFYYPAPKKSRRAYLDTGKGLRATAEARVSLAEIPFVRVRPLLGEDIQALAAAATYRQLAQRANDTISEDFVEVVVRWKKSEIDFHDPANGKTATLKFSTSTGLEFLVYTYLLHYKAEEESALNFKPVGDAGQMDSLLDELVEWNTRINGPVRARDTIFDTREDWKESRDVARERRDFVQITWWRGKIAPIPSRLEKKLLPAFQDLPERDPAKYLIQNQQGLLSLRIPPENITFDPPLAP